MDDEWTTLPKGGPNKGGSKKGGPPFRMVIHSRMDSFLFVKTYIELFWGFGHLGFWHVEVDSIILLQRQ